MNEVNFIGLGVHKAGTTFIYEMLLQHPEVSFPIQKEIRYFNRYLVEDPAFSQLNPKFDNNFEWYLSCFGKKSTNHKFGEISPMYFCDPCAPQKIFDTAPNAKLFVVVRNPIDRTFSHFLMNTVKFKKSEYKIQDMLNPAYKYIKYSLYGESLERYLMLFPRNQLMVIEHQELINNPIEVLKALCRHIGIDDSSNFKGSEKKINEFSESIIPKLDIFFYSVKDLLHKMGFKRVISMVQKTGLPKIIHDFNSKDSDKPRLTMEVRQKIYAILEGDIEKFETLIEKSYSHWH